jgi:hypothetical protein
LGIVDFVTDMIYHGGGYEIRWITIWLFYGVVQALVLVFLLQPRQA